MWTSWFAPLNCEPACSWRGRCDFAMRASCQYEYDQNPLWTPLWGPFPGVAAEHETSCLTNSCARAPCDRRVLHYHNIFPGVNPDLLFLALFDFLAFFLSRNSLLLSFSPISPKDLEVNKDKQILAFLVFFLAPFPKKGKEKKIREFRPCITSSLPQGASAEILLLYTTLS